MTSTDDYSFYRQTLQGDVPSDDDISASDVPETSKVYPVYPIQSILNSRFSIRMKKEMDALYMCTLIHSTNSTMTLRLNSYWAGVANQPRQPNGV